MASPIPIMASPKNLTTPKTGSVKLLGADDDLPLLVGDEARAIQSAYLYGQIFHAAKMAVWWSMFGPLLLAAAPTTPGIIGYARVAFNIALVGLSPLAGALTSKVPIRRTLLTTTVLRGLIWGILIPGAWFLSSQDVFSAGAVVVVLCALNLLDGTQVALANCVDMDCGGLDMLSQQHTLFVDDALRNRFNAIWQKLFDTSFILINPAVAAVLYIVTRDNADSTDNNPQAVLLAGVALVFILFSVGSFVCFLRIPREGAVDHGGVQLGALFRDVGAGLRIVCGNTPIAARLLFLGLETALEDAMVSVILAELVLRSGMFVAPDEFALGNLWVVGIVGVGKIGGVTASMLMKNWVPPQNRTSGRWRRLFVSIFFSSLSTILLPLSIGVHNSGNPVGAKAMIFVAAVLFFFFSTAPKIGFQTMLQSLVSENQAPQVFGFVGFAVTLLDGVLILLISQIFVMCSSFETALWIIVGIYVSHGVIELAVGPWLVLRD